MPEEKLTARGHKHEQRNPTARGAEWHCISFECAKSLDVGGAVEGYNSHVSRELPPWKRGRPITPLLMKTSETDGNG
jgi:hypothetical protein